MAEGYKNMLVVEIYNRQTGKVRVVEERATNAIEAWKLLNAQVLGPLKWEDTGISAIWYDDKGKGLDFMI